MSALPPGGLNGQKPTPPPGTAPLRKRKPPSSSNPLVPRQKPKPRPAAVHAPGTPMHAAASKNAASIIKAAPEKTVQPRGIPTMQEIEAERRRNGGWSTPLPEGAEEFPVILTKKGQKEGLRFHVMKLAPPHLKDRQKGLDPSNQEDFVRPVTLHRRDPRQPPPGRDVKVEEVAEPTPEQNEESQKLAQMKADREAQRAIDDAQKAPVMRDNAPNKKNPKQKEKKPGTQVHYGARTEAQKKQNEIRYEEALPWHLEDADGKHVWVGQYENPLSESKVALAIQNGAVQMVPLEKWYKFISKRANVNALSIEEAEKVMSKKAPVSRWAMRDAQREQKEKDKAESRLIVNGAVNIKQESATFRSVSRREVQDHDDIDVSGDEFQDDDETAGFEPERDEDSKDSKDRVRREQLGANLFGDADETTVDKEEAKVKKEELERKMFGKDLKKALKRRDKQFQYDSDDSERERDPFASSSESDTDTEDEEKKEEDKKDKDKDKDKDKEKEKDKEDGAGSKGSNTPQGKKSASSGKKGKSLKRAGSPGVSDSSGTESTRKKKAKTGPSSSSLAGSRSGTPLPRRPGPGSTSDGEATGGEMSDGVGGKMKKKQKLGGSHLNTGTNARGTPSGSRAGSPAPQGARSPATPSAGEPITGAEIVAMLPPQGGVTIGALLGKFRNRVGDEPGLMPRGQWIKLVKEHSTYDPTTKLLTRKT